MSRRLSVWRNKHMLQRGRHRSYISCCALVHSLNLAFSKLISSGSLTCSNLEVTQLWPAKSIRRSAGVHLLRTMWGLPVTLVVRFLVQTFDSKRDSKKHKLMNKVQKPTSG